LQKALPIQQDIESQKKLGLLIMDCFNTLNMYGKQPEQIESYNRIFQAMLGEYKFMVIKDAFFKYMKTNTTLPTPADIIKLIRIHKDERETYHVEFK
jgi:hypothetical protein